VKKDRLRILIFAPGFAPHSAPENIVNSKLALAFIENGWEVGVISKFEPEYFGREWEEPWLPLKEITHEIKIEKVNFVKNYINRFVWIYKMRCPVEGLSWANKAYNTAFALHKEKPFDIILSRATPFVAHLPAMVFAGKTGLPWIANWNDPPILFCSQLYDSFELESTYRKENFFEKRLLRKVASKAPIHTFPSEKQARLICEHLNIEKDRSFIIPHVALKKQNYTYNKNNRQFKICHAGSIHKTRNSAVFFDAISKFLNNKTVLPKFTFNIVGIVHESFQKNVVKYELGRFVNYVGKMSYLETLTFIASQDVLLVIEPSIDESVILPCKFIDYIQVGRPILSIVPQQSTLHDIVSEFGGGIVADCRSSESILSALCELFGLWEKGKIDTVYGSGHLYNSYSPETIINMYKEIFTRLLK
jgi:hypothetical protein